MKIIVNRNGLSQAFGLVSGAISSRDVKPILRNIKAAVESDRCTLMATDLELGIRLELRGMRVEEPGEAILPFAKLGAILKECPDEEVSIEYTAAGKIVVRGGRGKWELPTEEPSAFPDVPDFDADKCHEIKGQHLADMIGKTTFATSQGQSNFGAMSGVLVEASGEELAMVATDGHVLVRMPYQAASINEHAASKIVPVRALAMVAKNCEEDETVRVCLRENDGLFKTERAVIYTRLVEGRFPSYQKFIPESFKYKATSTAGELVKAIRQAAIALDKETVRVNFAFADNRLRLTASSQAGESEIDTAIESSGKFQSMFQSSVFVEPLGKLDPDAVVTFEGLSPTKPARMTSGDYVIIVMPLHVQE